MRLAARLAARSGRKHGAAAWTDATPDLCCVAWATHGVYCSSSRHFLVLSRDTPLTLSRLVCVASRDKHGLCNCSHCHQGLGPLQPDKRNTVQCPGIVGTSSCQRHTVRARSPLKRNQKPYGNLENRVCTAYPIEKRTETVHTMHCLNALSRGRDTAPCAAG